MYKKCIIDYHEIIKTIKNNYDEISSEELGHILCEYNNANWGKGTKISYGNNFSNWLVESDIMIKRGKKHNYTFLPYFLENHTLESMVYEKKYVENNVEQIKTPMMETKLISLPNEILQNDLKIIFNELITKLTYLEKNLSEKLSCNQSIETNILDCLDQLVNSSESDLKHILIFIHDVIYDAFKNNNKHMINKSLKILMNLNSTKKLITEN